MITLFLFYTKKKQLPTLVTVLILKQLTLQSNYNHLVTKLYNQTTIFYLQNFTLQSNHNYVLTKLCTTCNISRFLNNM